MAFEMLLERFPPNLAPVATLSLLALLLLAAGFDIAQRRVPNILIIVGATTALTLATHSGWPGISGAIIGSFAALFVLLPVYASGMMGAGDVKLISMVGAIDVLSLASTDQRQCFRHAVCGCGPGRGCRLLISSFLVF